MPHQAIIYDCEFLTAPGAPQRFWCGPNDPDPVVAQIGAVRLVAGASVELTDTYECIIEPRTRFGEPAEVHPLFEKLTGVTRARIDAEGVSLAEGLEGLKTFASEDVFWSWGTDEFNMLAISCFVQGITPPLPAERFGNATRLLQAAGLPDDEIVTLRSNTITQHFGLPAPDGQGHDALGDAQSVAIVLKHLSEAGKLVPERLSSLRH